jgi:hypothetical protein
MHSHDLQHATDVLRVTMRAPYLIVLAIASVLVLSSCTTSDMSSASGSDPDAFEPDYGLVVPDVVGMDGADAESEIDSAGLTAYYDVNDPAGCEVTDQSLAADAEAAEGEPVELTLDCRQRDWESQDGDDWMSYTDAFDGAAQEGCEALFGETDNGSLYEDDTEYTALDCESVSLPAADEAPPTDVPDDAASEGGRAGFDGGCAALFESFLSYTVYWGNDSYSEDDCTNLNPY